MFDFLQDISKYSPRKALKPDGKLVKKLCNKRFIIEQINWPRIPIAPNTKPPIPHLQTRDNNTNA